MTSLLDDLLDAWRRHNDVHLYLLDWMPAEGLAARTLLKTGQPSRGRDVGRTLVHLYEVRCAKLRRNLADASSLGELAEDDAADRRRLADALDESARAVSDLVRRLVNEAEPLRGWKLSPAHWLAYLIAHESHHRGQIAQALKQSGIRPPQEVSYGVWGYLGGYELPSLPK